MSKNKKYIMSLDEGTTSARAVIIDDKSKKVGFGQYKIQQYYPKPGWVEQDPNEIWNAQKKAMQTALKKAGLELEEIAGIGITNQRETAVLWDSKRGEPVHRAIVWQDRRTSKDADRLNEEFGKIIKEKTGLISDSYFSGPKISWLLEKNRSLKIKAEKGEILFGTIDSFLIFRLTGGEIHVSDHTNASRTMIFNIHDLDWDEELLEIMDIPKNILPRTVKSSEIYGYTDEQRFGGQIPISGSAGDQQAALFGQACYEEGEVKGTYGTGSFILMNTGNNPRRSDRLLTTIGWSLKNEINYALEGSIFIAGAGVDWLTKSLNLMDDADQAEKLANSLKSNEGVYFVPSFVGLGAPYWDQYSRGTIIGITGGTKKAHLARSALEAMGYFTKDVLEEMIKDTGIDIKEIRVDGGAAKNDFLMNFLSDITDLKVSKPRNLETTALGAAYLSGLAIDFWQGKDELEKIWREEHQYHPEMAEQKRNSLYAGWKKAVQRSFGWAKELDIKSDK